MPNFDKIGERKIMIGCVDVNEKRFTVSTQMQKAKD